MIRQEGNKSYIWYYTNYISDIKYQFLPFRNWLLSLTNIWSSESGGWNFKSFDLVWLLSTLSNPRKNLFHQPPLLWHNSKVQTPLCVLPLIKTCGCYTSIHSSIHPFYISLKSIEVIVSYFSSLVPFNVHIGQLNRRFNFHVERF